MVTVPAVKSFPPAACAMGRVLVSAGLVPARLETGAETLPRLMRMLMTATVRPMSRSRRVPGYGFPERAVV